MATESELNILKLQVEQREKAFALEEKMLESLTLQGKRTKGIAAQRKKMAELQKASNKMKSKQLELEVSMSAEMERQAKKMKTQAMLLGGLQKAISKIQDLSKRFSENTRATANTMHLNVNEAKKLNKEILGQLKGEKALQTNMKDVVATQSALSDAYGGSMKFTAEQAVNLDIASKKLGISNTQAAQFSSLMFATGESSQEVQIQLMAATKTLAKASGVKFDAVMSDIASSGKDVAGYFGTSGKELAIMAVQARKMGFELADVKSMSEGLLDVENRIEKQMKFNLLTGKNINLDKATALALEGDHAGMMKEVVKQAGNLDGLNQLEIKALNEALGVDIMKLKNAEALREQKEAQGISAASIAETEKMIRDGQMDEFLAKEVDRQLAATAEERRENFENNMLDKAAQQLGNMDEANNLALILQGIQMAIQGIMMFQGIAAMVKARSEQQAARAAAAQTPKLAAEASLRAASAVSAITTNSAVTFGVGAVIALAAAGIGAAAMYALMSKPVPTPKVTPSGDVGIDPNGGPVVMSPKEGGIFQGTKNDGVSMSPSHGTKGGGGMNIQPLIRKMDELISAVKSGRVISVDGYQLNEAIHLEKTPAGV